MKPAIQKTSFGSITVENRTYDYDVLIRANGYIEKRKKKLSKKVYGTSHILSLEEAEYLCEEGISKIIIGSGQYGALNLSAEAKDLFDKKHIPVVLADTPHAIVTYNNEDTPCVGLYHVTC